jgi:sodium-dependent dicarboxylate transporter 2/3/5
MQSITAEPETEHSPFKTFGLLAGIAVFFFMLWAGGPEDLEPKAWKVLAVMALMAVWWMTEAIPVAATALVPLVAIPFLGVGTLPEAAEGFTSKAVFLPLGGFILGIGLQRWNLHQRIALHTVRFVGTEPKRVVGGFMLATALVSMWISNTATAVMMLPIALSVGAFLMEQGKGTDKDKRNFGICLMIGIAYAASMGGLMTLVGTSTNVMYKGFVEQQLDYTIGFGQWMLIGVPIGLSMLVCIWWGMTRVLYKTNLSQHKGVAGLIETQVKELGRMKTPEKRMAAVFAVTAGLWIFGQPIEDMLKPADVNDASIAIAAAIALFMLPSGGKKGERLLQWKDLKELPWGILILLAGGLSIAGFIESSGLADWVGAHAMALKDVPVWILLLLAMFALMAVNELMSNVAALTAFLPILTATAVGIGTDPLAFTIPLAFVASCSFMLPISTPPNAIVFGSGYLRIRDMVRAGVTFNILGVLIISMLCALLVPIVFPPVTP